MAPLLERGNAPSSLAGCFGSLTLCLIMADHLMCNSIKKRVAAAPASRDGVRDCERGVEAGEEIVCSLQSSHAAPYSYPVHLGFSLPLCRPVCLPMCTGVSAQHIFAPFLCLGTCECAVVYFCFSLLHGASILVLSLSHGHATYRRKGGYSGHGCTRRAAHHLHSPLGSYTSTSPRLIYGIAN